MCRTASTWQHRVIRTTSRLSEPDRAAWSASWPRPTRLGRRLPQEPTAQQLDSVCRPEQSRLHHGLRDQPRDVGGLLEGRQARRGARLRSSVVLRHADAQRRHVRGDGRGGRADVPDPPRDRRADPLEPHRSGRGQRAGVAERAGPWPHRLRHLHRIHRDRKSTRLNSSHVAISYAVFCLKKKKKKKNNQHIIKENKKKKSKKHFSTDK